MTTLRTAVCAAIVAAAGVAMGQGIREAQVLDLSSRVAPSLEANQANFKGFTWTVKNSKTVVDLSGYTPIMYRAASNTAAGVYTAACAIVSATGGTFTADWSPASLNATGTWVYGVGISASQGPSFARQSTLTIWPDAYASGGVPFPPAVSNINLALYSFTAAPWATPSDVAVALSNAQFAAGGVQQIVAGLSVTVSGGGTGLVTVGVTPSLSALTGTVAVATSQVASALSQIGSNSADIAALKTNTTSGGGSGNLTTNAADTRYAPLAGTGSWWQAYGWGNHALAGYLTAGALGPYLTAAQSSNTFALIGSGVAGVASWTPGAYMTNTGTAANPTGAVVAGVFATGTPSLAQSYAAGNFSGSETITPRAVSARIFCPGAAVGATMTGDAFAIGNGAGNGASGPDWQAIGNGAGAGAEGSDWGAYGFDAGNGASGWNWGSYGYRVGWNAIGTNWCAFGTWAGRNARGNNRFYIDAYGADPGPDSSPTNDIIFGDDGVLYLGRGNPPPNGYFVHWRGGLSGDRIQADSFYGNGVGLTNVPGATPQTNVAHNALLGIQGAGYLHVSATDTNRLQQALTNAGQFATAAQGATADSAVTQAQRVGDTNALQAGINSKQAAGSYITPTDTNGWTVTSHAGFLTGANTFTNGLLAGITNGMVVTSLGTNYWLILK